jgi:hypothetical protein
VEFPCFKPKAELPWPALCVTPLLFRGPPTAKDAMVKADIAISAIFPFMFVFMFFPFFAVFKSFQGGMLSTGGCLNR